MTLKQKWRRGRIALKDTGLYTNKEITQILTLAFAGKGATNDR